MTRASVLKEDASLAAFYLLSLAAGVMIVSLRGQNLDLLHVLFGSVLGLDDASLLLIASIASVTLASLALLFRPLVMECFDPAFLRGVSRWSPVAHYGFLMLVVVNLVSGFHALGTLMAVGIMILPSAAARLWAKGLPMLLLLAVLFAFGSGAAGLLLSFHADRAGRPGDRTGVRPGVFPVAAGRARRPARRPAAGAPPPGILSRPAAGRGTPRDAQAHRPTRLPNPASSAHPVRTRSR